jgi:hypothetical protein
VNLPALRKVAGAFLFPSNRLFLSFSAEKSPFLPKRRPFIGKRRPFLGNKYSTKKTKIQFSHFSALNGGRVCFPVSGRNGRVLRAAWPGAVTQSGTGRLFAVCLFRFLSALPFVYFASPGTSFLAFATKWLPYGFLYTSMYMPLP